MKSCIRCKHIPSAYTYNVHALKTSLYQILSYVDETKEHFGNTNVNAFLTLATKCYFILSLHPLLQCG